jgi:hypothetical protein
MTTPRCSCDPQYDPQGVDVLCLIHGADLKCLDASGDFLNDQECSGTIEYRTPLSATGRSFPRCAKHWTERLDVQEGINRRYPTHAPSDFDPAYAGESWEED